MDQQVKEKQTEKKEQNNNKQKRAWESWEEILRNLVQLNAYVRQYFGIDSAYQNIKLDAAMAHGPWPMGQLGLLDRSIACPHMEVFIINSLPKLMG